MIKIIFEWINRYMIKFIKKPFRWAILYSVILILSFAYVLLDTFIIPKEFAQVDQIEQVDIFSIAKSSSASAVITDMSYQDEDIKVLIDKLYVHESMVYIADIEIADISYLRTAFAKETYGLNITQKTSKMAQKNNAILAINGDFYGFRQKGYVIRNGILYRDESRNGSKDQALVIDDNGDFSVVLEKETEVKELTSLNAWQVFTFGPALISGGNITVNEDSEVAEANPRNPRTAIGQITPLHYIFIVVDGRSEESQGLTLLELAQVLKDKGCTQAYNLDGGGSSTMWFNSKIINIPSDGRKNGEREVSDIVFIGK